MLKKIYKNVVDFFKAPRIGDVAPTYLKNSSFFLKGRPGISLDDVTNPNYLAQMREDDYRSKMESIALAEMALQKKAQQHTITIQHRTMIITLFAVIIALFSSVTAIFIAINQPQSKIMIELKDSKQKTIQKSD